MRADVADSRVVDHDVEAPEVANDGREGVVDLLPVRDVRRVGPRLDTRAAELLCGDLRRVRVDLEHCDTGTGVGELLCDPAAEPGAGPGHDRDSSVEHTHLAILASLRYGVKMTIVDSRC